MVGLLSRSRMVAIVPSLEGHAPASLTLRALDGAILWLSDAGESASRELLSGSQDEPSPGERGAQASIFRRSSRCEAEFGRQAQKIRLWRGFLTPQAYLPQTRDISRRG